MKILVGIPVLYGLEHTKQAIKSVFPLRDVDLLIIDNNSEQSIKDYLIDLACEVQNEMYSDLHIIYNEKNEYVNPAWNQILSFFRDHKHYDICIIMNSDLIMQRQWKDVIEVNLRENEILIPSIIEDRRKVNDFINKEDLKHEVGGGVPGVFIVLTREQVEKVYPIPEFIKIWFGDNWIYEILRRSGEKLMLLNNLMCYHYWSQNVQKVEGVSEMIEEDKRKWAENAEKYFKDKLK